VSLQEGSPRVFVGNTRITQREIMIMPHCISEEEVDPLRERLLEVIAEIGSRSK